jgi:hypothetical protein
MKQVILGVVALSAVAGTGSLRAQSNIYSLNVVGYYNVDCPAGQRILICNQLATTNDHLSSILPGPWADGTIVFPYFVSYNASPWDTDANAWSSDFELPVGRGSFLYSQVHQTFTFVGEVPQGTFTNRFLRNGRSIYGPFPPLEETLSQMNLPAQDGDIAFQYRNGYTASPYDTDAVAWSADFTNKVGEAFFYYKGSGNLTNWVMNFTVQ